MGKATFEPLLLPEAEKERLARSLLAEFGVTSVRARGDELIHSCPLPPPYGRHANGDAHPSASLNFSSLTFNCLGCGNSGGLLWFVAVCRGVTGKKARSWLEGETGTGPEVQDLASLLSYFDAVYEPRARDRRPPMPRLDARVLQPWRVIHPYLTEIRGIPEANIVALDVGYGVLPTRDMRTQELVNSDRIVIPHFWQGSLVGWQSRRIVKDGTPKYASTPDMPKSETIYHYDPSREVVVAESPMTVVAKHHLAHWEATFGASLTMRQIRLLADHPRVVLWFDNDPAGWNATHIAADALSGYLNVWVVPSDWDEDPAGLSDDEVCRLLDAAVPYSVWSPPKEIRKWDHTPVSASTQPQRAGDGQ